MTGLFIIGVIAMSAILIGIGIVLIDRWLQGIENKIREIQGAFKIFNIKER